MDVFLVTFGSAGDVHPLLGLGQALKTRGHSVTLIANGGFETLARPEGLAFVGLPDPKRLPAPPTWEAGGLSSFAGRMLRTALQPLIHGWSKSARVSTLAPLIRPVYQAIADRFVRGRSVVVAAAPALGARLASEKLGIPHATVHFYPASIRSLHRPPVTPGFGLARMLPKQLRPLAYRLLDRLGIDPVLAGPLNRFRLELKLPPLQHVFESWRDSPELILGLYPSWFGEPQSDWPRQLQMTGFPLYSPAGEDLPPDVATFLDAGSPPIVFTPGTAMKRARHFFEHSVAVCRQLGRRGLLLTGHRDQVPSSLPASVHHAAYAPLARLLPRCDTIVHHGGIGTTAQAIAAGIPQLVVPQRHDQPDNAERLCRLGVARQIAPGAYDAATVSAILTEMDDPLLRFRCRTLAARVSNGTASEDACQILESWASTRLPRTHAVA
jgi:UDP:flavonoid glycosyltransferase YjiC (YdhE family)